MQIRNTAEKYGVVAKSLHWIIAVLIIAAWIIGTYMVDLPNKDPSKFKLFDLHKSIGMAVLMLAIIRLSWRLYDGSPKFSGMNLILVTVAKTVHYLLYLFMFVQPLSGWAMSSAAGHTPNFFGLFIFFNLVPQDKTLVMPLDAIHNTSAVLLLALFILHVAGALLHHFILKDNTLRRMTIG